MVIKGKGPGRDKNEKYDKTRINEDITSETVRLVGESGEPVIIATTEADRKSVV